VSSCLDKLPALLVANTALSMVKVRENKPEVTLPAITGSLAEAVMLMLPLTF
jgi:hypothetical protein